MNNKIISLITLTLLSTIAATESYATFSMTTSGNAITIASNGIPYSNLTQRCQANHTMAEPNPLYSFKIPKYPSLNTTNATNTSSGANTTITTNAVITPLGYKKALGDIMSFGVAFDGVPFDPLTGQCDGNDTDNGCDKRLEGVTISNYTNYTQTEQRLGMDPYNGHCQSAGNYHYHAIPYGVQVSSSATALLSRTDWTMPLPTQAVYVGYAADGFKIYVAPTSIATSSYTLTSTDLDSKGSKGGYSSDIRTVFNADKTGIPDNTVVGSFTYTAGSGTLDECNGTVYDGAYAYFITRDFPFVPRCLKGKILPGHGFNYARKEINS